MNGVVYSVAENRMMNDGTLISSLDLFFLATREEAEMICDLMSDDINKPDQIVYTVIRCEIRTVEQVKKLIQKHTIFLPEVAENNWYCPN